MFPSVALLRPVYPTHTVQSSISFSLPTDLRNPCARGVQPRSKRPRPHPDPVKHHLAPYSPPRTYTGPSTCDVLEASAAAMRGHRVSSSSLCCRQHTSYRPRPALRALCCGVASAATTAVHVCDTLLPSCQYWQFITPTKYKSIGIFNICVISSPHHKPVGIALATVSPHHVVDSPGASHTISWFHLYNPSIMDSGLIRDPPSTGITVPVTQEPAMN